jgi:hypothetical protein
MMIEGPSGSAFEIRLTFVEVYMNAAFDLLEEADEEPNGPTTKTVKSEGNTPPERLLKVREGPEGQFYAEGAQEMRVASVQQLLKLVRTAASRRTTMATGMHAHSSRSHAILTLVIEKRWQPQVSII